MTINKFLESYLALSDANRKFYLEILFIFVLNENSYKLFTSAVFKLLKEVKNRNGYKEIYLPKTLEVCIKCIKTENAIRAHLGQSLIDMNIDLDEIYKLKVENGK